MKDLNIIISDLECSIEDLEFSLHYSLYEIKDLIQTALEVGDPCFLDEIECDIYPFDDEDSELFFVESSKWMDLFNFECEKGFDYLYDNYCDYLN